MAHMPKFKIVTVRPITSDLQLGLGPVSAAALLKYTASKASSSLPSGVTPLRTANAKSLFEAQPRIGDAPVDLLPSGETKFDIGLPAGEGLSKRIYDFVMERGGDFAPPPLFRTPNVRQRQGLEAQLTINIPGRPVRRLVEMPKVAVTDPLWLFLNSKRETWASGWRWVFDPEVNAPVFISTPNAYIEPRAVMVLLHGACGKNSGPQSLIEPGSQFVGQGFAVVCAPTPFHVGFGPTDAAHFNMESHMAWRGRIADASLDYFHTGNGPLKRVLMGRSTGGNEALQFAQQNPGAVDAVIALSPYHPEWWEKDEMTMDVATQFKSAQRNDEGTTWNGALDRGQWTFMGNNIPAFPSNAPTTRETFVAFFQNLQDTVAPADRRGALRESVINRLPETIRNHPDALIELTPAVLQQLLPGVELPKVESDSFLAKTTTPTLIYVAGPDLEYTMADPHHFIVWVLAAAQNPNVKIVLAPRGDHDPWQKTDANSVDASKAFQTYVKTWLDGVAPRKQTHSTAEWGPKLNAFHMAWKLRQAAGLPTDEKITELRQTDPGEADSLLAQKLSIIDTVNEALGTNFSYDDMASIGERLVSNGKLKDQTDKVMRGLNQLTNGAVPWRQIKGAISGGLPFDALDAAITALLGRSPFTPPPSTTP